MKARARARRRRSRLARDAIAARERQSAAAAHEPLNYDPRVLRNRRFVNFLGAVACAGLLAYAYYSETHLGLEPCPLCIFQRVTLAALGAVFLIAALHSPRSWGAYVYAGLIGLASLATIGLAGRHVYIQSLPPGSVPSCGAPLEVMLEFSPLATVIARVLKGGGECSDVNWSFIGLSMPGWVLVCALVLGVAGAWANVRRPPGTRLM